MSLPFFYSPDLSADASAIELGESNSKHIVQVLRMKENDQLCLSNGKGLLAVAQIMAVLKKKCEVVIQSIKESATANAPKTAIAISPVKNASRFEWFLEKATELGVAEIWPLICHRTERDHFRHDRMKNICVSAMLQSQQAWLPNLHQPIAYEALIKKLADNMETDLDVLAYDKWIAHCDNLYKSQLVACLRPNSSGNLILIGPEGDFTPEEIEMAKDNGFRPVGLGYTRLRTETAGVVAASLLQLWQ